MKHTMSDPCRGYSSYANCDKEADGKTCKKYGQFYHCSFPFGRADYPMGYQALQGEPPAILTCWFNSAFDTYNCTPKNLPPGSHAFGYPDPSKLNYFQLPT